MGHRTVKRKKGRKDKRQGPSRRRYTRRTVGGAKCQRVSGSPSVISQGYITNYWVHHPEKDVAAYTNEVDCNNEDKIQTDLVKKDLIRKLLLDKSEYFRENYEYYPGKYEEVIALIVERLNSCANGVTDNKNRRKIINNEFESILASINHPVEVKAENFDEEAFSGVTCKTKTDSKNFVRTFKKNVGNKWDNFKTNTRRNLEEFQHQVGKTPSRIETYFSKSTRRKPAPEKPSFTPHSFTLQATQPRRNVEFRNPPPFSYESKHDKRNEPEFGRNPDSHAPYYYNPLPNQKAQERLERLRPPPRYNISGYSGYSGYS
jgi:hypothetical protein